jgi:hypothetical protein
VRTLKQDQKIVLRREDVLCKLIYNAMSRLIHLGSLPDWGKTSLKIECVVRCSGFKRFQTDLLFRGVKNHDFLPMCGGNDNEDLTLVAQLSNRLGNQVQIPDSIMKQKIQRQQHLSSRKWKGDQLKQLAKTHLHKESARSCNQSRAPGRSLCIRSTNWSMAVYQ